MRGLAPDEVFIIKPVGAEGLKGLQQAARAKDFIDLSKQEVDMQHMGTALDEAAPGDPYHPYDEADAEDNTAAHASEFSPQPPVAELAPEPGEQAYGFSDFDIDETPVEQPPEAPVK